MAEMRQPMLIDGEWVGAPIGGREGIRRTPDNRARSGCRQSGHRPRPFRLARVATRSSEPASQEDGDQGGDATGDLAG